MVELPLVGTNPEPPLVIGLPEKVPRVEGLEQF